MRVRLSAAVGDTSLKAWFFLDPDVVPTIRQVKENLCTQLDVLRQLKWKPHHIRLLLEDFELLDEAPIQVLKEGDLLCINAASYDSQAFKRKAEPAGGSTSRKRAKPTPGLKGAPQKPPEKPRSAPSEPSNTSSDSGTGTSSESESSSCTSEASTTSDDSNSESSSDSSLTSSPPRPQPILKSRQPPAAPLAAAAVISKAIDPSKLVPPGQGKAQTQKRNDRRRRKRQHARDGPGSAAASTSTPTMISVANETPLGTRNQSSIADGGASGDTHTPIDVSANRSADGPSSNVALSRAATSASRESYMMASLSNKNKRRGYKTAPDVLPAKIVFSPAVEGVDEERRDVAVGRQGGPRPRLIPPSDRQERGELPRNMFVTSVDVEEGLVRDKKGKSKAKSRPRSKDVVESEESLDYGEALDPAQSGLPKEDMIMISSDNHPIVDWEAAEKHWLTSKALSSLDELHPGMLLGWKQLAINPATFTPEMLLHLGSVTNIDPDAAVVLLQPLSHPGVGSVSFGGVEMEDMPAPKETVMLTSAIESGWRIM